MIVFSCSAGPFCRERSANESGLADHLLTNGGFVADDLYFMRTAENHVKIGRAGNVDKRISQIQIGCPHEIVEVLSLEGRGHEEKQWHETFAAQRLRGEWFRWTPELEKAVKRAGKGLSWKVLPWEPDEAHERLYKETFGFTYSELQARARLTTTQDTTNV